MVDLNKKQNYTFYKILLYIITLVQLISVIIFVLPNMSTNTSSYKFEEKILNYARIQNEANRRLNFNKKNPQGLELVLVMTDGTEWIISSEHSKSWNALKSVGNVGKTYKLYLGKNIKYGFNPVQIEIDGHVIYTPSDTLSWRVYLLIMALFLTLLSTILIWIDIKKRRKTATNRC